MNEIDKLMADLYDALIDRGCFKDVNHSVRMKIRMEIRDYLCRASQL